MLGKRILIIGSAGAGKTTLARKLHALLQFPLIHMDRYYWQKNWGKIDEASWQEKVLALCEQQSWIMDGNYTNTLALRMKYASAVIYLDVPRWLCLTRVIVRRFRLLHNRKREDIPQDCHDRLNLEFYRWIWNYPKRSKPKTLSLLKAYSGPVFIVKTNKDIKTLLSELQN